eukprot:EST43768.1 Hypothetical protein SS50377_16507 [Spironucleus salmonicida]
MVKKIKKAGNDCGFLNGTYSKMQKKYDEGLKTVKKQEEFQTKFQQELSLRPSTDCKTIQDRSKSMQKEGEDISQAVKAMKQEIDRSRVANVLPSLLTQALDYERQYGILTSLPIHITAGNDADVVQGLKDLGIGASEAAVKGLRESPLLAKLGSVEINQIDKLVEELKDSLKATSVNDEL